MCLMGIDLLIDIYVYIGGFVGSGGMIFLIGKVDLVSELVVVMFCKVGGNYCFLFLMSNE